MTSNGVIDVAIGLILMYLVLALLCTSINEFVAQISDLRAKTLRSGLQRLIDDRVLLDQFNDHGLIDGLRKTLKGGSPSYIAPATFAAAILDSLDPAKPLPDLASVKGAIEALPPSNIKDALLGAMTSGVKDLDALRANVAAWFDDTMDRLSGVFKRYMRWITFGIGLATAIALNADSITVAQALWSDSTLRSGIAAAAEKVVAEEKDVAKLGEMTATLRPLPIGWSNVKRASDVSLVGIVINKLLGWLITAIAITLGAPFWFDLLGKFVQIRSSGQKPADTSK
jgi:hypothetical protein